MSACVHACVFKRRQLTNTNWNQADRSEFQSKMGRGAMRNELRSRGWLAGAAGGGALKVLVVATTAAAFVRRKAGPAERASAYASVCKTHTHV